MKTPLLRFLFILLLSLCLHLALLLLSDGDAVHISGSSDTAMQSRFEVRLVSAVSGAPASVPQVQNTITDKDQAVPKDEVSKTDSTRSTSAAPTSVLPHLEKDTATYYPSQILGEKPRILDDPLYEMAHKLPTEATGTLVLRLRINAEGTMDDVIVEKSDIKAAYLPQLQRAAMGMRFTPGRIDGKAVNTEMRIEVEIDNLRQWP